VGATALAQSQPIRSPQTAAADPVATLVARLDLVKYKTTIKGLTQFGDRRQGTERNRAAIDWMRHRRHSRPSRNSRVRR
jgi:hypothetical protein